MAALAKRSFLKSQLANFGLRCIRPEVAAEPTEPTTVEEPIELTEFYDIVEAEPKPTFPSFLCEHCSKLVSLQASSEGRSMRVEKLRTSLDSRPEWAQRWKHYSPYYEYRSQVGENMTGAWWDDKSVCPLCRFFQGKINGSAFGLERMRWILVAGRRPEKTRIEMTLNFKCEGGIGEGTYNFGDVVVEHSAYLKFCGAGPQLSLLPKVRNVRGEAASMERMLGWMTKSDESYNRALPAIENARNGWNPTRLLDVANLEDLEIIPVRLGNELPPNVQYATLSHCWGLHIPEQLNIHTEKAILQGQKLQAFCPLFQDVIKFVRFLKIQYLWIDSLCILQGKGGDWSSEASQMSKVYSFSWLNVAASASIDGTEPLFKLESKFGPLSIHVQSGHMALTIPELKSHGHELYLFQRQPLHDRAWVVQELYLSPRIAFCTSEQLYWLDNFHMAKEDDAEGLHMVDSLNNVYGRKPQWPESVSGKAQMIYGQQSEAEDWNRSWEKLVRAFMITKLTYATDRLIAFAGVAQTLQSTRSSLSREIFSSSKEIKPYFAGLWHHRMPEDLCWICEKPNGSRVTSAYVAPTWSWASMEPTGIYWPRRHAEKNYLYKFRYEVKMSLATPGLDFGEVRGGMLRTKVPTSRGKVVNSRIETPHFPAEFMGILADGFEINAVVPDEAGMSPQEDKTGLVFLLLPFSEDENGFKLWCGLVLSPTAPGSGTYTRFGTWSYSSYSKNGIEVHTWKKHFKWESVTII